MTTAGIKEGETVVDLGSGAGIDVFIAAKYVGRSGKAIGVDMTDRMLSVAHEQAEGGRGAGLRRGGVPRGVPRRRSLVRVEEAADLCDFQLRGETSRPTSRASSRRSGASSLIMAASSSPTSSRRPTCRRT